MRKGRFTASLAALALCAAAASSVALAQQEGRGPGAGLGPGYGPGYGGGPGMMGGYGYGPGAGGGYGPGMMGGYGYGPGMMGGGGGYGRGWVRGGMGQGGPLALLNLTDDQRAQIAKIQEDNRSKNWNTMGQMRAEMFKLRQMYYGDKLDPNAVAEQQRKVDESRRQLLKSRIEARNQIDALLTAEQRQQLRSFGPWWQEGGE